MSPSSIEMEDADRHYVVVGVDGKRQGPMLRYRVIELLERNFIGKMDRVCREGEALMPLTHHPDFAGYFISGDSRNMALEGLRSNRSKRNRQHRNRERMQGTKRFFFWLGILLSPFFVYRLRFVMFPDPMLDWMHARVFGGDETIGGRWAAGSSAGGSGAATRSEPDSMAALVQSLRKEHSNVKVKATLLYEQGWQQITGGEKDSARQAIPKMEQAVVSSGGASWAVAGLAASKVVAGAEAGEKGRSSASLLALLKKQGASGADISTVLAAKALGEGANTQAYGHADDCTRQSEGAPECQWMAAVAMGRAGRHEALPAVLKPALVAYPDSPELALWSASLALEQGQWAEAAARIGVIEEALGENPHFLQQRAQLRLATGQLSGARQDFSSMERQLVDGRSATLMHSILLYQVDGLVARAADQLKGLANGDLKGLSQKGLVFLHASHAARLMGWHEDALAFAVQAVDTDSLRAEGLLAQAMALEAAGDVVGAEAAFDQLEGSELKGREAARLHAWAAGFYARRDRVRMAATERSAAEAKDPHWAPLVLLGVQQDVRLKDGKGLQKRLAQALLNDLEQDAARLPLVRNFGVMANMDDLSEKVVEAFGRSPALSSQLPWMVGTIHLLQCPAVGPCPGAQREFERALRKAPKSWPAHAGLARIALRQGQWALVLKHLEPVIAQRGESAVVLAMRGAAELGLGKHALARETLERAVRLDPQSTASGRALVATLAAMGKWRKAQAVAENVWRLEPNDSVTAAVMLARPVAGKKSPD